MGAMTAIMVGLGAASAVQQFTGGQAMQREANYNASAVTAEAKYNAGVYQQQVGMVEAQKQLQAQQDDRAIRMSQGRHIAVTAAKGIQLSGSAMAVLADTMTQLSMDKAIGQFNYDMKKFTIASAADSTLRKGATLAGQYVRSGATAYTAGVTGALTSIFNAGAYIGMHNINTSGGVKTGGKV